MHKSKNFPKISQAIWLLTALFAIIIVLFFIYWVILNVPKVKDVGYMLKYLSNHPELIGIINFVAFSIVLWWGFKRAKTPFSKVFPFNPVPISLFFSITLIIVGLSIIMSDLDNLLRIVFHIPVDQNGILYKLSQGGTNPWLALVTLSVVAPLTEEFMFRGLILTGFLNNYSVKTSILVSGILFGAFHLNLNQFFGASIIGFVFAWLLVETNSLWPCIFGHALNNAIPLVCIRLFHLEIPGYTVSVHNTMVFQPLWFDIIGLVTLVLGLCLLLRKLGLKRFIISEELRRDGDQDAILDENELITIPEESIMTAPKSQRFGLITLLTGIAVNVIFFAIIIWLRYFHHFDPHPKVTLIIVGLIVVIGVIGSMVGFGLGLTGLFKNEKKRFVLSGLVLNGVYILFIAFIIFLRVRRG